jgi:hypothetical protein
MARQLAVGSWLSGRQPTKVTVESGYTLDIGRLVRTRAFVPGAITSGTIVWRATKTGEQRAVIGYEAQMADSTAPISACSTPSTELPRITGYG